LQKAVAVALSSVIQHESNLLNWLIVKMMINTFLDASLLVDHQKKAVQLKQM
jgi:hypothetical protein